jgi:hypothetical protein
MQQLPRRAKEVARAWQNKRFNKFHLRTCRSYPRARRASRGLRPQENLKPGEEWKAPRGKKEMTRPTAAGGSEAAPAAKILPVNLLLSEIWRQGTTDSESAQNSLQ